MRNKLLIFTFTFLSCFSFVFAEQRVCNKNVANVRSGSSANSAVISSLKRGDVIEVTQEINGWVQFKLPNGTYGWVKKNLTVVYYQPTQTNESNSSGTWIFIIIVGGVIGLIVLISGLVLQCPKCNKWWARESKGSDLLKSEGYYKTITREDIQRNSKGEEIGRTQRQEQVHMVCKTYRNYYQCKHCQHSWSTISTNEYEG